MQGSGIGCLVDLGVSGAEGMFRKILKAVGCQVNAHVVSPPEHHVPWRSLTPGTGAGVSAILF